MYNGQAHQDKFVLNVLKEKQNGFFWKLVVITQLI